MYFAYLIYILILGIGLKTKKSVISPKRFLIMSFGGMVLLAGLRGETVGTDTKTYNLMVERMIYYGYDGYTKIWDIEPGFGLLLVLIGKTVKSMQYVFMLFSLFTSYSFARFIYKHSTDVFFSTLLYYLFIFPRTMNICRMYVAIGFFLFAYDCILNKERIRALALILAATLFHESAWLLLSVWLFSFIKKIDWRVYVNMILCGVVLFTSFDYVLPKILTIFERYSHYLTKSIMYKSTLTWKYAIIYGIVILISTYYIFCMKGQNKVISTSLNQRMADDCHKMLSLENNNFILMSGFFIWSIVFLLLSGKMFLMDRFFDYFYFSFIIITPNGIRYSFDSRSANFLKVLLGLVFIYAGMNSIVANIAGVYPYMFCF